jgi:hypothetical protein
MIKLMIVGDIHTHYSKVERIIKKYEKTHKFIFMGDYFDQFGDTPELNASTAHWLKTQMEERPDWVYLKGNHDEIYDPRTSCMCSGFSSQKKTAINEVMKVEDWDKLKYFHHENKWWFSHAGFTKYWFSHPMKEGITLENVQRTIQHAITSQRVGEGSNAIWASSHARGGDHAVGGIVWQDWRDLELIPNFKQVVGHTPLKRIQAISDNMMNSTIINVDNSAVTYHGEVLEIDESGNHKTIDTSYI